MTYLRKKGVNQKGSALIVAMGMVFLVGATTSSLFYQGLIHSKFGERSLAQTRALELANSGIELARYTMRHSASDCFSTEIAKHTLFNNVPLGEDGHFTVEVLANPNNPYTAKVISTGTYSPVATSAKVEAKMTCGFLNALDSYAIITAGDLFVSGPITTDSGDYTYNDIHADGSITLTGSVEIPPGGLTVTQAAPVVVSPPQGVTITQTATPSGMPVVNAGAFTQQMPKFYPENDAPKYTFHNDGKVTDGANNVLLPACSPCGASQVFKGISFTPAAGGVGTKSVWSIIAPSSMEQNANYVIQSADLSIDATVGSEISPFNVAFVVKNGDLKTKPLVSVSLDKQPKMGNSISRAVAMVVDGKSYLNDVYLKDVAMVVGGTLTVTGNLGLSNGAVIAGGNTVLNSVDFRIPYNGSPVNHNERAHGSLLAMDAHQTEYYTKGVKSEQTNS